jgi:hypothetical protein
VPTQTKSRRYIFQADATGVAAQFVQPIQNPIPIQATSAIASDGGYGCSRADGYMHDIFSFRSAYTEVRGIKTSQGYETLALSVVEGFKLLDIIECERIEAQLIGTYPADLNDSAEASIVPTGSVFRNLRIGKMTFPRLEVAAAFCSPELSTWTGLLRALGDDRERRLLEPLSLPAPNGDLVPLPSAGAHTNMLGFSIALEQPEEEGLGSPLIFPLPGGGTVTLGEYYCKPESRRLIMLRVELNGEVQGSVVVGDPLVGSDPYP